MPVLLLLGGCFPSARGQLDEEKEPHFLAGKSRVSAMDYRGAIDCFIKALEVNPQSGSAHFELGWLYDQKEQDPAAAIYHYQNYLRFRPEAPNSEMVKTRVVACKQELARTVSLGPIAQNWQKEFDGLAEENRRLKGELDQLRLLVAQLKSLSNQANVAQSTPRPSVQANQGPAITTALAQPNQSGALRTHVVKSGETLSKIARIYQVRLDRLMDANPGLDARKLQVGQTIKIPAR